MSEWIDVHEKLPEKGQNVLTVGVRGSMETIHFRDIGGNEEYWWWKRSTIKHITHWMPLPAPPKRGTCNE